MVFIIKDDILFYLKYFIFDNTIIYLINNDLI